MRWIVIVAAACFAIPTPVARGAVRSWKDAEGRVISAELVSFSPEAKTILLREAEGGERTMATGALSFSSQVQLLFSPRFLQSVPAEGWPKQRNRLVATLVGVTGGFLLAGFWIAAAVVVRTVNPLKAIIGWSGSILVFGFLFFVYLTAARKFPDDAVGFLVCGAAVAAASATIFVSIVYSSTMVKALVLFILHFALAVLLLAATIHGLERYEVPAPVRAFFAEHVLVRVGLLAE